MSEAFLAVAVLSVIAGLMWALGAYGLPGKKKDESARIQKIRWREAVRVRSAYVARILVLFSLPPAFLVLFMPSAAAQGTEVFNPLVAIAGTLLVGGILLAAMGWVLSKYGGEPGEAISPPLVGIGAVVVILGIAGFAIPIISGLIGGGGVTPPPDGSYVADWDCNFVVLAAAGPGGAHDGVTEFPDSPFIVADGGTPDYDATIATPVYTGTKLARIDINVDDERTAVPGTGSNHDVWLNEDTYAFDINCKLRNPPVASGGGLATVPLWARASVPYMMGQAGNSTVRPVFVCDASNGGVYMGWGQIADSGAAPAGHDADHDYISYKRDTSCGTLPTVGDWMPVGSTSTTAPTVGQYVAFWFLLDSGIISYEDTTVTFSIGLELGTDPTQNQHRGNTVQLRADIIATDDA